MSTWCQRLLKALFILFLQISLYAQITSLETAKTTTDTSKGITNSSAVTQQRFRFISQDSDFTGILSFRPEYFYTKNVRLLNNNNRSDVTSFAFYTFDIIGSYSYGHASQGYNVVTAYLNLRSQGAWGYPGFTLETTEEEVPYVNSVKIGPHRHDPRQFIPWIRELWLSISLSDLLGLHFCNRHVVTIGAFPFQLGRGIALGVSQLRAADVLSFSSVFFIRQYNFGIALSGILIQDKLIYDLYGNFIRNQSAFFNQTDEPTRRNVYGHRATPQRGFGSIDYLIAARLRYMPITDAKPKRRIYVEPYILYAHNPDEPLEVEVDIQRDLVTIGTAAEFEFGRLGFGFDTAFNMGKQVLQGLDRNSIIPANARGFEALLNTQVLELRPGLLFNAFDIPENQAIINTSAQTELQNGRAIGRTSTGTLFNSLTRFRDTTQFALRGSMFVFDIGYLLLDPQLRINGTVGYASGGVGTSCAGTSGVRDIEDFIGINENYFGIRVKSIFVPSAVSFFSNLFLVGAGLNITPQAWCRKWIFNPNIVAYWKDSPLPAFDRKTQTDSLINARQYLGFETNLLAEVELVTNFRFFALLAAFFPGDFYKDIRDRPLSRVLTVRLNNLNSTGIEGRVPRQGSDIGYIFDVGFQYDF